MASSSQNSSISAPRNYNYDVFVSFRGEDTRNNFTDFLFDALETKGIFAFRDDSNLSKGESIAPDLLRAIQHSQIYVVVFSKNYASSTWCLQELEKICECFQVSGKHVLPVFYDVDPSDVRHQKGIYADAFAKHGQRYQHDSRMVSRWREALTQVANLYGWDLRQKPQSAEIKKIVSKIRSILDSISSSVSKDNKEKNVEAIVLDHYHEDYSHVDEDRDTPQISTTILKVDMPCKACSQEIKRLTERIKGVKSAEPDLKNSLLTVKGVLESEKLVQYAHKRNGKQAVIVKQEPEKKEEAKETMEEEKKTEEKDKNENGSGEGGKRKKLYRKMKKKVAAVVEVVKKKVAAVLEEKKTEEKDKNENGSGEGGKRKKLYRKMKKKVAAVVVVMETVIEVVMETVIEMVIEVVAVEKKPRWWK